MPSSEAEFGCLVCGAANLVELDGFSRLPRVTSDCKPFGPGGRLAVCPKCGAVQKPVDPRWQQEADAIYREYQVYFQSDGVEQAVFDAATGAPRRRSAVILDRFEACRKLPPTGTLLDVGCGTGALLTAFAELRPQWRLNGHDIGEISRERLSRIASFQHLYTGPISALPGGFDVVTLIHSLEHLTRPAADLAELRTKIAPGGCLLIQVPDGEATPFDLLIADHVSHFAQQDLARLLGRAGYRPQAIAGDWVVKELSAVATAAAVEPGVPPPPDGMAAAARRRVEGQLAWLNAVTDGARQASKSPRFGLFGSSISAMWLWGDLAERIEFFVDEDPSRRNTRLFDRPVLHPSEIAAGSTVFMPLIPAVARAVARRLAQPGIEFVLPPDIPAAA